MPKSPKTALSPRNLAIAYRWGSLAEEWTESFPCDPLLPECDHVLQRGVNIAAPAEVVFRWLCQMKVAPYSYDWIDNFGRRSPAFLTPGAELLRRGEPVMTIFRLADFAPDQHITLQMHTAGGLAVFGEVALTYRVTAQDARHSRLAVRLRVRYPRKGFWRCMRYLLPWGDLIMMRRQLLNFQNLAESSVVNLKDVR